MMSGNMLYRAHPWHGLTLGEDAPHIVNCYIEMVPTDTIKYELDKESGILRVDRPQKYSSLCPTLYGLLPKTYAGKLVGDYCAQKTGITDIIGDGDPLDVCVFTDNVVLHGDILLKAAPIGGFRLVDGGQADDKIIAVMVGDFIYDKYKEVQEFPETLIERLRHYFLTYKDIPEVTTSKVQITHIYGAAEAREIIQLSQQDYRDKFLY
jgi:inorganic pyrophosphatase